MADLITWDPVEGAGPYQHDLEEPLTLGSTAGYSSPPTIAQVNAGAGFNQIIAEIRRRQELLTISGTDYQTDIPLTANRMNTVQDAIDAIRVAETQTAYSWTTGNPFANTQTLTNLAITEFRTALATASVRIKARRVATNLYGLVRQTSTTTEYPPAGTIVADDGEVNIIVGQNRGIDAYTKSRGFLTFAIPAGISINTVSLKAYLQEQVSSAPANAFTLKLYVTTDWGTLDTGDFTPTLDGSVQSTRSIANGDDDDYYSFAIEASKVSAGSNLKLYFISADDESDTPPPNQNSEGVYVRSDFTFLDIS